MVKLPDRHCHPSLAHPCTENPPRRLLVRAGRLAVSGPSRPRRGLLHAGIVGATPSIRRLASACGFQRSLRRISAFGVHATKPGASPFSRRARSPRQSPESTMHEGYGLSQKPRTFSGGSTGSVQKVKSRRRTTSWGTLAPPGPWAVEIGRRALPGRDAVVVFLGANAPHYIVSPPGYLFRGGRTRQEGKPPRPG